MDVITKLRGKGRATTLDGNRLLPDRTEERRLRLQIILSIWIVIVLVGLPWWWLTTRIYRADLPLQEIARLGEAGRLDVGFNVRVQVLVPASVAGATQLEDLALRIQDATTTLLQHQSPSGGPMVYTNGSIPPLDTHFRFEFPQVQEMPAGFLTHDKSLDIRGLDRRLRDAPAEKFGEYCVYVLPASRYQSRHGDVAIGARRNIYICLDEPIDGDQILQYTSSVLVAMFAGRRENLRRSTSEGRLKDGDYDEMRTFRFSGTYNLIFSLVNGDMRAQYSWEIEDALRAYVKPFIDEMSVLSDFAVQSQVLFHSRPHATPTVRTDAASGQKYYALFPDDLRRFVNSADWLLSTADSVQPSVNIITYLPPKTETPLHVVDQTGEIVPANSFMIPRWGAVMVLDAANVSDAYTLKDLQPTLELAIQHLRHLLGVQELCLAAEMLPQSLKFRIAYFLHDVTGITGFELDRLIRKRIVQNIADSARMLNSLGRLVQSMPNMVLLDTIGSQVRAALRAINEIQRLLNRDDHLHDLQSVFRFSHAALVAAECAFFDATMVSKLYFPDEHRLAIYTPLFVPTAVSLVMSAVKVLRRGSIKINE